MALGGMVRKLPKKQSKEGEEENEPNHGMWEQFDDLQQPDHKYSTNAQLFLHREA